MALVAAVVISAVAASAAPAVASVAPQRPAGTAVATASSGPASDWGWLLAAAVLLALAALALAVRGRARHLRDAQGSAVIVPEYDPPDRIDALQSALLLGLRPKAIPAEVLEQAVRGSIRIVPGEPRRFGGYRLTVELVDRTRADDGGRMLLNGLFGAAATPGAMFVFGRSNVRFARAGQRILAWGERNLTTVGLRSVLPRRVRAVPLLVSAVSVVGAAVSGSLAIDAGVTGPLPVLVIVGTATVFVASLLLLGRRPLTAEGVATRDRLHGLWAFIASAEADRIRVLTSPVGERAAVDASDRQELIAICERLLPYALIFGREKEWARHVSALREPTGSASPAWYAGACPVDAAAFSAGIASLASSVASPSPSPGPPSPAG